MLKVLLVNPPFSDIGAPYPGIAHLTAYLRHLGYDVDQCDLGLRVFLRLFSQSGVTAIEQAAKSLAPTDDRNGTLVRRFLSVADRYSALTDSVVRFLQGHDEAMARAILSRRLLPEGPRLYPLALKPAVAAWFAAQTPRDQARFLASHFLFDLFDVIKVISPEFGFQQYGQRLLRSRTSFSELDTQLRSEQQTVVDQFIIEETRALVDEIQPDVMGFSCPFPGAIFGTLRTAQEVKRHAPRTTTVLGGGFVNTELRRLSDPRVFDYIDFVLYDDGERPMEVLLEHLGGRRQKEQLFRARYREADRVVWVQGAEADVPFRDRPAPDYRGLPTSSYLSVVEPGLAHQLWADKWNKLIVAHGCYWKRCTFCDTTLDYIGAFAPDSADGVVKRMESVHATTGWTGFHFVDEAAPPALLKAVAMRIRSAGLPFTWWGNVRFDQYFTPEVCRTLADGGCIAVSGGIEVASERVLRLIDKGVDLPQLARVTWALASSGIKVHGYLMYGFPSQTAQETVDSLEIVRQLFAEGCLHSAFWHRFALTEYSPIARNPAAYGIEPVDVPEPREGWFAFNVVKYEETNAAVHRSLGQGLQRAVQAFMLGEGLTTDVRTWLVGDFDAPSIPSDAVRSWIAAGTPQPR